MSKVDWSLAPEGASHYRPDAKNVFWYKERGEDFMYFEEASGQWCYSSASDRVVRSFIERPTLKPWSGPEDGLPPVNVEVEAYYSMDTFPGWKSFTMKFYGQEHVIFEGGLGETHRLRTVFDRWQLKFRPLRTADQIAADKRETSIRELMDIAQVDCRVTAARLVDAGFKLPSKSIEDPKDGIAELSGIIAHANFRNSPNSGDGDLAKQLYGAGFRRERNPDNPFR